MFWIAHIVVLFAAVSAGAGFNATASAGAGYYAAALYFSLMVIVLSIEMIVKELKKITKDEE